MRNTIINFLEIKKLFREYCEENRLKFSEQRFKNFSNFLEIDFYDWVKENLNQFKNQ